MKNKLQEKFDGFGSIPSNDVWAEIERQLNQKKKRRVLIFWFSSGIAACLIGLFLLINFKTKEDYLAKKSQKINLTASQHTTDTIKDSIVLEKEPLKESRTLETQKNQDYFNTEHKELRTNIENKSQDNFSNKLTELSHQFDEKKIDFFEVDSTDIAQKEIEIKDSLNTQDSLNSNENNVTNVQNLLKIDSTHKRKAWSLEFGLTTWDAFKNKDQTVTSNSSSNIDSESTFWNSNTANSLNSSTSTKSVASICKPLTLNLMLNYTTKKNLVLTGGFNLDVMKLVENDYVSKYTSLGLSYALGYQFNLSQKISFVPQLKNNYDFYRYTSSSSIGKDYSLNSFSDNISGFQNSLQLDLKLRYTIDKHSIFCISPTNRYYLSQSFENLKLLERKYWYGIQFSYQYNF